MNPIIVSSRSRPRHTIRRWVADLSPERGRRETGRPRVISEITDRSGESEID